MTEHEILLWRKPNVSNPNKLCSLIENECSSWYGTPKSDTISSKNKGASCASFAFSILDYFHKIKNPLPDFNKNTNNSLIKLALKRYSPCSRKETNIIEPGDILLFGSEYVYSGHLFVVGGKRNHMWHTDFSGVVRTGININPHAKQFYLFRSDNKESWLL